MLLALDCGLCAAHFLLRTNDRKLVIYYWLVIFAICLLTLLELAQPMHPLRLPLDTNRYELTEDSVPLH